MNSEKTWRFGVEEVFNVQTSLNISISEIVSAVDDMVNNSSQGDGSFGNFEHKNSIEGGCLSS